MEKTPMKKQNLILRLLLALLVLVLFLAGAAVVIYRDRLNLDAFKRWYTYRSLSLNDSGQAESFRYSGSDHDVFVDLGGDLLVCGKNTLGLYSGSGVQYIDQTVSFSAPAAGTGGGSAVVYDAGGSDLYVFHQREQVFSLHSDGPLLSARLNDSGMLTVVSQQSGYRGVVTVYYDDFHILANVGLSSTYVMDAQLTSDGKTLCIVTVSQEDGEFTSSLLLYDLDTLPSDGVSHDATPTVTCPLDGNVILDLDSSEGRFWALGDKGMRVFSLQGTALGGLDWSDCTLKACSLSGDGFAIALLGRYRTGSQSSLSVVDSDGVLVGTLTLEEQVLSVDAAGRYFAVLAPDRLDIYTKDLTLYSTLERTQGAQKVLLRSDGSAILISPDAARLYVPS